ncbi:MAG: hypothetical protein ACOXZZ_01925 [Sphaerochaetaceae bacterium]|jgi:hypothetical protein
MFSFFIKKSFFDGWDNILSLLLYNFINIALIFALYFGITFLGIIFSLGLIIIILTLALNSIYQAIISIIMKGYVDYKRVDKESFKTSLFKIKGHIISHFIIQLGAITLVTIVLPFYLSFKTIFFYVISILFIWLLVFTMMALFYFYPLALIMDKDRPLKSLKKSFVVVVDNLFFTLGFGVYHLVNFIISLFFATLIPGVSGVALSRHVAMKILMKKYDFLEEFPEQRKELDWYELLYEEDQLVGKRTFKGTIFPWKE